MEKVLDKIGEWNPQLFREIKGRFKPRNLIFTISGTLIVLIVIISISSREVCGEYINHNCIDSQFIIKWKDIFRSLNWILPIVLLLSGIYFISSDLAKEEHIGSLNFIRLSPQSSQKILTGKILGIPCLFYLAIVLSIPLHLISGLNSGVSIFGIIALYTLWILGSCLFFNLAIWITFTFNNNKNAINTASMIPWAVSLSLCVPVFFYNCLINFSFNWYNNSRIVWKWKWFYLSLGENPLVTYSWIFITLVLATYFFWQGINRGFKNPNFTLLKKADSYLLVTCFQLWIVGFVMPRQNQNQYFNLENLNFLLLFGFTSVFLVALFSLLFPHRQKILDWATFQHKNKSRLTRNIINDLIWGENSPPIIAIGINLLISSIIWISWLIILPSDWILYFSKWQLIVGILAQMLTILIYTIIYQIILLKATLKAEIMAVRSLIGLIFFSILIPSLLVLGKMEIPLLWMFSPISILAYNQGNMITVCFGLLLQIITLGLLGKTLTKQVKKIGESQLKILLQSSEITNK